MKKTVSILLLFSLVCQCLGCLGVFAWYGANRQYIAQALCENRDRPERHCLGQCVLMKKLKKLEDKEKKGPGDRHANPKVESVVFLLPESTALHAPTAPRAIPAVSAEGAYLYLYSKDDFHPPRFPSLFA
ncbi:hypothetical protein JHJ32_07825 [Parapedobacter sp. ISTM3]|uniref:hypothetical protein n=1 Tax=Parapedobacter sp. ISTM3 TaxID=2800130 RepID=UPI0019050CE8|nr:hypothetical protein [Parapedobacter sp. ISTM3]MBK1439887.1 hypothetical protein [Parapedobacter sp. ISTM3]